MATEIVESTKESELPGKGTSRSQLVQRLLSASSNLPQFVNDLLTTQAVVVAGTEAAGFVLENKEDGVGLRPIAHIRPDTSSAETRAAAIGAFTEIIKPCLTEGKDGAIEINPNDTAPEKQFCLVTLLRNEGQVVAVSAVITRCFNLERAQQRLVSMQLVAGYFELFTLRRTSEQATVIAQSHQHVLQLATAVATAEGFESAAMNLCNELATRTHASRVTLGWIKGRDVRVKAFSHTEQFDKKQELVVQIEKVMEECADQEEPVHYDPDGGGSQNVSRASQALSRSQGGNVVLSLPLRRRAETVGVVTLEFPADHKLTPQASTGLSVAVDLLAPQLYDRYQNDRWLITKAGLSTRDLGKKIIGPQHMLPKLIAIGIVCLGIFLGAYRPMYHVAAPFQFEAIGKRVIDMPVDGHIKTVYVRPGDRVTKGQLLLQMDDRELIDNMNKSEADAKKSLAEANKYKPDPTKQAEVQIAMAEYDAHRAEADLYRQQIDLVNVKAPFDGIILKGELMDQVGQPKKQGEELFEIAPDDTLRAVLSVNERDIQALKPGSTGSLVTSSLPTDSYRFKIDRVVPASDAKEGENVFTVYAVMDPLDSKAKKPAWADGMAGEARVDVEHRALGWIWTHKLADYVRLKVWLPW